ncbi:MAG: type IX secretion system protein PorQ [Bacteroidetes bacterium]|nr:type IX secretion system protein PorQ [Bacteroidota bacterium]
MKSKIVSTFLFLNIIFSATFIVAQTGGEGIVTFLKLPTSARVVALGGDFLAIDDNDITIVSANPSLITPAMNNRLGLEYVDFFTNGNFGVASYGRHFNKLGSFVGTLKYLNYGEFDGYTDQDAFTGKFNSSETALNLGWGRHLDSMFSIGANLKLFYSSLETYKSYGLAVDVAGSYTSRDERFTASLIASNVGRQFEDYGTNNFEPLPFEIQVGLSQLLKHLPFRYSILYNNLEKWNLRYEDPDDRQTDPITGEIVEDRIVKEIADNFMRHIVVGGEVYIGKYISLRAGYNYKRRQEMKIASKASTIGFSWGIGLRVSRFHFAYSRSAWHLAGSPNYITLTTNLSDFYKKKN